MGTEVGILLGEPRLLVDVAIFGGTVVLIGVNALVALWTLTYDRKVLVGLNCTQIVLFGLLNF